MTIDKSLLVSAVSRNHLNFRKLSKLLGVTPATFSRKIKTRRFTLNELYRIKELLHLSDKEISEIFLSKQS